jgi:dihydroxyacid dehydratase/phosphogluconate dehydratase
MRPSQRSRLVSHSSEVYSGRQRQLHARRHGGDENAQGQNGQIETAQPARDRGTRARAAPVVFLRHGPEDEEIHQPFVGVATCWNEAAPCNIALSRQAQAVKLGVKHANGTPREFTTITVTDGIAMGHEGMRSSLASRDAIADTVELTMRGHCYDALVGLAGCDKSLPGMMMAMVRLNVPSVFIYGGSILPVGWKARTSPCRTCSRPWASIRPGTFRTRRWR